MHLRHVLLAGTVSALALVAGSAFAQNADEPVATVDDVVVTGIRAALQQSLQTKRNANAIIDVITAEDVGKFPSSNVAEAMVTIPGVTIDRAFGQGEKVSILGTDPALSRTLLNGQTVASADWFISDQPGRTFNYSLLAPQLVGKIEVYKSPEAHIDEGSIGGTVIISTRKPLDLSRTTVSGQVSYLYNDRIESGDPQASILFGWKNQAETFGLIFSAQTSTENIRRDGIESYGTVTGRDYAYGQGGGGSIYNTPIDWSLPAGPDGEWQRFPGACGGACETTLLANLGAVGPNSISAHYFEQERQRDTLSLALQFRPTDKLNVEANILSVKAGYDNISHSMFAFNGNAYNALMRMTDLTVDGGVITKATFKNALSVYDLINRQATVETNTYDVKAAWTEDNWFASVHLGTTKATGGTGRQVFGEFLNWADYSYDISGDTPKLTYTGSSPFTNPGAFQIDGGYANPWHTDAPSATNWAAGWGGNIVTKPTWDKENYAQVDFGVHLNGPIHKLRFGAKRREHDTGQSMSGVALAAIQGYGNPTAAQFDPRDLPGNYLAGFGDVGSMSRRFTIDGWALANYILSGDWLAPWQTMPEPGTFNDSSFVSNTWNVSEDIDAFYGQADFDWNGFRGNLGVRYVRTTSESVGWQCLTGTVCAPDAYSQLSVRKTYDDVLPNLNIAYDFSNDLVLRFSAAKVISRPNYGDMSNYLWLGPQTLTGGGGNPNVDPYRSTNIDASAEWYFAPNSIIAGTVFYKDVGNYILTTTGIETHFNQSSQANTPFVISRPNNAGAAKIQGVSINYQQDIGLGFGVLANYTYSDAQADSGDPMPWTSEHQYSISPFFESGRWSARATYSWRSKYYTQVDRGNYLVTADYASLDASLGAQITDKVSLKLDGMNLLDSEYYTYAQVDGIANTEKLVRGLYRTGRRVMLTASMAF